MWRSRRTAARNVTLAGVNFRLKAGQAVAVIGPSGAGKSTLARGLVGIWPVVRGELRFDGAMQDQWHPDDLGKLIGYLPQEVELFDGTRRRQHRAVLRTARRRRGGCRGGNRPAPRR